MSRIQDVKAELKAAGYAVSEGDGWTVSDSAVLRQYAYFNRTNITAVAAAYSMAYPGLMPIEGGGDEELVDPVPTDPVTGLPSDKAITPEGNLLIGSGISAANATSANDGNIELMLLPLIAFDTAAGAPTTEDGIVYNLGELDPANVALAFGVTTLRGTVSSTLPQYKVELTLNNGGTPISVLSFTDGQWVHEGEPLEGTKITANSAQNVTRPSFFVDAAEVTSPCAVLLVATHIESGVSTEISVSADFTVAPGEEVLDGASAPEAMSAPTAVINEVLVTPFEDALTAGSLAPISARVRGTEGDDTFEEAANITRVTSSDEAVLNVVDDKLLAVAPGIALVTVSVEGTDLTGSVEVEVVAAPVEEAPAEETPVTDVVDGAEGGDEE